MRRPWLVVLLLLASVSCAWAQMVVNPTKVEYSVSADHASVTRYQLGWFLMGAIAPVQTADLPVVAPDLAGKVVQPLPSVPIAAGTVYVARIKAWAGTIESEWSADSNPFTRGPSAVGPPIIKR